MQQLLTGKRRSSFRIGGGLMPLMTFAEAIADSNQFSKRHLLLGNGFSIACRADIFHYGSLFAQADFSQVPEVATRIRGTWH